MADKTDATNPGRALVWIVLFVVGLLMLYVLSVGPAALLLSKTHPSGRTMQTLEAIYAPLNWLHDHTALKQPLEFYVGLWRGK